MVIFLAWFDRDNDYAWDEIVITSISICTGFAWEHTFEVCVNEFAMTYPDYRVTVKSILSFSVITLVFPAMMFVIFPVYHHHVALADEKRDETEEEGDFQHSHASHGGGVGMIDFTVNRKDVLSAEAAKKAGDVALRTTLNTVKKSAAVGKVTLAGVRGTQNLSQKLARRMSTLRKETDTLPNEVLIKDPVSTNELAEDHAKSEESLQAELLRARAERDAALAGRKKILDEISTELSVAATVQVDAVRWRLKTRLAAERRQRRGGDNLTKIADSQEAEELAEVNA
jgi:hypothetical protein